MFAVTKPGQIFQGFNISFQNWQRKPERTDLLHFPGWREVFQRTVCLTSSIKHHCKLGLPWSQLASALKADQLMWGLREKAQSIFYVNSIPLLI